MPSIRRRAAALVASGALLVLAGCGGAGYGDPIAATDGDGATVALAPAPVTTPAAPATGPTASGEAARTGGGSASPSGQAQDDDGAADGGGATDAGGSGGTAVDELAAYAADANRFCTGFKDATRALTQDIGAAGPDAEAIGRAIVTYGDAITVAARGIRAAPVPSAARSYHARTIRWVDATTDMIAADRSGLRSGDTSAGARVIERARDLGRPPLGSAVPAALRDRAGACAS